MNAFQRSRHCQLSPCVSIWSIYACRMIDAGVGVGIVAQPVALRHRKMMQIAPVGVHDPWAQRKFRFCVRSRKDLPPFARGLVDRLMSGWTEVSPPES